MLLASFAERSHFQVTVPLVWALRSAGHEVLVATQPQLVDDAAGAGLPVVAVGSDHTLYRALDRLARLSDGATSQTPSDSIGMDPARLDEFEWSDWLDFYRFNVGLWWRLINDPILGDLVTLCRQWRPDLVLWEALTFSGAVAAQATGVPHVRLLFGSDLLVPARRRFLRLAAAQPPERRADPLRAWLDSCARRHGTEFSEELITGLATVGYLPRPLRLAGTSCLPARYVPYNGRSVVPGWIRERPPRPRVGVTTGISAVTGSGRRTSPVQRILAGLADLDVEVVATITEPARADLGPVPDNVRLTSFVPLDALAATCSAVVNHGGAATMCTVLRHGVPQLVVPATTYDEGVLAGLLARTGAGSTLDPADATPTAVRQAVSALLHDPAVASAARHLADQARAMPTPADLVPRLERLLLRPRPTRVRG